MAAESLSYLQGVNGPLSLVFNGNTYGSSVNLASATSFAEAVTLITAALNYQLPVVATTTGSTITPEATYFTGSFSRAQLTVDSVQSGTAGATVQVGGIISGTGVSVDPVKNQIIYQHSGTTGGAGSYSCFGSIGNEPNPEPMTETYGILNIGNVTSGTVAVGEEVAGAGVPQNTAIIADLGNGQWLVNNDVNISSGENLKLKETPLTVSANQYTGATQNNWFYEIQPNGAFGYDNNPSTLSFASGSAADLLGLSQAYGAMDSSPGGQHLSINKYMSNILTKETNQFGQPVQFDQLQTTDSRLTSLLSAWAQSNGVQFI